jgi:hypothetical protein
MRDIVLSSLPGLFLASNHSVASSTHQATARMRQHGFHLRILVVPLPDGPVTPPATRQHQPGQHRGPLVGVPNPHAEDIGRGLLVRILRQAGIHREELRSALILFPARSETNVPQPK